MSQEIEKIRELKERYKKTITEYRNRQKETGPITAEHLGGKIILLNDVIKDLEELSR